MSKQVYSFSRDSVTPFPLLPLFCRPIPFTGFTLTVLCFLLLSYLLPSAVTLNASQCSRFTGRDKSLSAAAALSLAQLRCQPNTRLHWQKVLI